jgi:tetratricopeptide (TPR) repeat protein
LIKGPKHSLKKYWSTATYSDELDKITIFWFNSVANVDNFNELDTVCFCAMAYNLCSSDELLLSKGIVGQKVKNSAAGDHMESKESSKIREFFGTIPREPPCKTRIDELATFLAAARIHAYDSIVSVEVATELRALDRLDEAEVVLESLLDAQPDQASALIERGHVRRQKGDYKGAADSFKAAAAANPDDQNIRVELSRALRDLDRADEANSVINSILDIVPNQVGALVERGHLLRQKCDHEGAAAAFTAAAAGDPTNINIQLELAREFRALDRLTQAGALLAQILDREPGHVWAMVEHAHVLRRQDNHEGAVAAFEIAAKADPYNHDIQVELARDLRELNRLETAEQVLRTVTRSGSANVGAWIELAQVCRDRGDLACVFTALEAAIKEDPTDFDLKFALATECCNQGHSDAALQALEEIVTAKPDHIPALMRLGQHQRSRGELQKSQEAFRALLKLKPNHTEALVELASDTWAAGEPIEARQLLMRAISQEPNNLRAIIASAELAMLAGDRRSALQSAYRAIELDPKQMGPYLLGARAAAEQLEREESNRLLDQARKVFGDSPEIAAVQIHVLRQYRDYDAAYAILAEAGEQIVDNFELWMQATSFAIGHGRFAIAEQALRLAPATPKKKMSGVHCLRAALAEARRQYQEAAMHYETAIALDGAVSEYHEGAARCYLLIANTDRTREHLKATKRLEAANNIGRGKSNISQHHVGQLLDEFVLHTEVLSTLRAIVALPANDRIETLRQVVQENPEQTAPAILLLLAMRQEGKLASHSSPIGRARGIPKRIVHYWHDGAPPPDVREIIASWREKHPDYEHVLLDNTTATVFLRERGLEAALRAFHRAADPGQRADILRLAYLLSSGGFFIDVDDRCLARLDTFIEASVEFAGYQDNYGTIGVNFLGVITGHPVIGLALDNAVIAVNRGDRDIVWLTTGPGLLTRAFAQSVSTCNAEAWLSRTSLLELWEFQRAVGIHCPAHYKRPATR